MSIIDTHISDNWYMSIIGSLRYYLTITKINADVMDCSYTDMFRAWVLDDNQVSAYTDVFPTILREVGRQKAEEMFLVS